MGKVTYKKISYKIKKQLLIKQTSEIDSFH